MISCTNGGRQIDERISWRPGHIPIEKLIGWMMNEDDEMESLIRLGIHDRMSHRPNLLYRTGQ
jgi:hypothetical protein